MPSIACRDTGNDCDWFFKNDDTSIVLVSVFKHVQETHPKDIQKDFEKYKVWEVLTAMLRRMKP
jgi:predicted small metal-binding protein